MKSGIDQAIPSRSPISLGGPGQAGQGAGPGELGQGAGPREPGLGAPGIAHRLGVNRAFALELDYVSCGAPVALRVARDMLLAEPAVRSVLAVAGSRESYLLDYASLRSRFMFGFGDGAVAALLVKGDGPNQVLGSHALTDGSLALAVKVPAGGSVAPGVLSRGDLALLIAAGTGYTWAATTVRWG